jgi:hypothetical protein
VLVDAIGVNSANPFRGPSRPTGQVAEHSRGQVSGECTAGGVGGGGTQGSTRGGEVSSVGGRAGSGRRASMKR